MDNQNGKPATGVGRKGQEEIKYVAIRPEKIDFEIREIIRVYPEQIVQVIDSFTQWARQFDL